MKKLLLIALAAMFVSSFAYGADYIAIYFDTGHSVCRADVGANDPADWNTYYYVFALPGTAGLTAVEFKVGFPPIVVDSGSLTLNAGINLTLGAIDTGWSATFAACQPGGTWIQVYRQRVYLDTSTIPDGVIALMETDDSHNLGLSTCQMMDASFTVLNHGHINQPCVIGTKDASWGAIKSLF
jgi:hypothetical protein